MVKHVAVGLSVLTLIGVGWVATPEAWAQTGERRVEIQTLFASAGSRIGIEARDTEAKDIEAARLDRPGGVIVEAVADDSPAARSGLRVGDLILEFDGERVRSTIQFRRLVQETPAGRTTAMTLFRDGSRQSVQVVPEAMTDARVRDFEGLGRALDRSLRGIPRWFDPGVPGPRAQRPFSRPPRLGVALVPLSDQLRTYFGVNEGVLVSEVTTGSPAAEAGLRAGDVITHVAGVVMNSAADVVRAVGEAGTESSLEIAVVRDGQKLSVRANIPGGRGRQPPRQPVWPV